MRRLVVVALAVALGALSVGKASLHHPDEPMAIPVSAAGVPDPLPFQEFSRRRAVLLNQRDANRPLVNPDNPTEKSERGKVADRIEKAKKNPARTPEQSAALAVDLLRFNNAAEAPGALKGQRRGFLPNVTLAHVAAAQNEWGQAFEYLDIANEERPPAALPGISKEQLAWQLKLNRDALVKLFRSRLKEAQAKDARQKEGKPPEAPDDELPDPIFAVDFTKVDGPALAPDERAKLPPDALATVQQLLLWFPNDARLFWLLAELYAANGELATAQHILNECAQSLAYSNRKVLMQHRQAVALALKEPEPPEPPISLRTVGLYFGAVALVALFAGVRAVLKWRKGAT